MCPHQLLWSFLNRHRKEVCDRVNIMSISMNDTYFFKSSNLISNTQGKDLYMQVFVFNIFIKHLGLLEAPPSVSPFTDVDCRYKNG